MHTKELIFNTYISGEQYYEYQYIKYYRPLTQPRQWAI